MRFAATNGVVPNYKLSKEVDNFHEEDPHREKDSYYVTRRGTRRGRRRRVYNMEAIGLSQKSWRCCWADEDETLVAVNCKFNFLRSKC